MSAKNYPMRHITRMNSSWLVRLYATYPDYYVYDYFYDKDFDDEQQALAEAQQYRDWLEETWPMPDGYVYHGCPHGYEMGRRANNRSGRTGVHYSEHETIKTHRIKNVVYRYKRWVREWRATWREENKNRIKHFSIGKHGYIGAKIKAIAWRKKMEALKRQGDL